MTFYGSDDYGYDDCENNNDAEAKEGGEIFLIK
jgi:hypothetical protein